MKTYTEVTFLEIEENEEYVKLIESIAKQAFREEKMDKLNLYLHVILTNPNHIQETNQTYRHINQPTDVLSFPMFEKEEIEDMRLQGNPIEQPLGDIMISIPRVKEQAEEYGHSFKRELAYMVIHGFYHLMGYDHMEAAEKEKMRSKEENVLKKLNINR